MILVKVHEREEILAICDSDLVGKNIENDKIQLDITERFYAGEEMDKEKTIKLVDWAKTINIVGKESIKFAIEKNIISKEHVIYIKEVPHAQVFKL